MNPDVTTVRRVVTYVGEPKLVDAQIRRSLPEGVFRANAGLTVHVSSNLEHFTDGYHSIPELYDHRRALNIALFNMLGILCPGIPVGKARLHNDGSMFEGGYFVVFAQTMHGQISYHYRLEHWSDFNIPEFERVPYPYDGHTPADVLTRLRKVFSL